MASSAGRGARPDIDMRQFARSVGTNMSVAAGQIIFNKGDPGQCMYIVQSGSIEILIGDKVVETLGANEALGFICGMLWGKVETRADEARWTVTRGAFRHPMPRY